MTNIKDNEIRVGFLEDDKTFSINSDFGFSEGDWVLFSGSEEGNDVFDFEDVNVSENLYMNIWIICEIGSNYICLKSPLRDGLYGENAAKGGITVRLPFSKLNLLKKVSDMTRHIDRILGDAQLEFQQLTQELTSKISNYRGSESTGGSQSQEVAIFDPTIDLNDKKNELIELKEKTLPAIQEEIVKKGIKLSNLAALKIAPYTLIQRDISKAKTKIDEYIFNIDLYAGMSEKVIYLKEGSSASFDEKIHIFQEKLYMDEESLLGVLDNGFRFESFQAFNEWLIQPENLNRIFPFEKCLVSFQVRRTTHRDSYAKGPVHFENFLTMMRKNEEDKYTYIYFRNGGNIGFIVNEYEVGDVLFDNELLEYFGSVKYLPISRYIISDKHTEQGISYYNINNWAQHDSKIYGSVKNLYQRKLKNKLGLIDEGHWSTLDDKDKEKYLRVDTDNLYYDDVNDVVNEVMTEYNRFGMILMGLLDRSNIFSPHPKVDFFSESYTDLIKLVQDYSSVLPNKLTPPDMDSYLKRGQEQIKAGSHVYGAFPIWQKREAKRANEQYYSSGRSWEAHPNYEYYIPEYDPYGCGVISVVDRINRKGEAVITWMRPRAVRNYWNIDAINLVKDEITIPVSELYNVDFYQKGDYKEFFDDKRTRIQYFKWASFMLACEEFIRNDGELEERDYMKLHSFMK